MVIESLLMLLIEPCCDGFYIFAADLDVSVRRQYCIIKDRHPTVVMPFCEPQLLCILRTSFTLTVRKMGGKGKALYISPTPSTRGCHTCSNVYSLFFLFFFQLSSFNSLGRGWRLRSEGHEFYRTGRFHGCGEQMTLMPVFFVYRVTDH